MAGRFEEWIRGWRLGFNGPNFRAFAGALAATVGDRVEAEARQAAREALPSLASDEGSLALFGADVSIDRGPTETAASYRERLSHHVSLNKMRGKALGMLSALYWSDFPGAVLVTQNGRAHNLSAAPSAPDITTAIEALTSPSWYVITAVGTNPPIPLVAAEGKSPSHAPIAAGQLPWWYFDANWSKCNRFGIIFPLGTTVDLTVAANLARIKRVIRQWKGAHQRCFGVWVVTSGLQWGWPVTNTWGGGGLNWGGTNLFYAVD